MINNKSRFVVPQMAEHYNRLSLLIVKYKLSYDSK